MGIEYTSNPDDPRLEDFRDIRDRDLRGRQGIFIGEQGLVVERMLDRPELVRRVLVSEARRPWLEDALASRGHPDVACLVVPTDIVERIAGFDLHRGVLASGNRAALESPSLEQVVPGDEQSATILCCDSINNMDNIGMLFRTAAAFGVDAVLLSPTCHDPLYRKSLRVSIGHALTIPFLRCSDWAGDLARLQGEHDITLVGACTGSDSKSLDDVPSPARVALVVGSEYEGLQPETRAACDHLARIPMARGVDSLNVAVATAVLLERLSQASRD
ncbi:MAG: RNA methyltransferase [Phycisphaerales bacterium]|nr:RNA methyltransferase [Phycisphaerales bacterium]